MPTLAQAPSRKAQSDRLLVALRRSLVAVERPFARELFKVFGQLGVDASRAYLRLEGSKAVSADDAKLTRAILRELKLSEWSEANLAKPFERHYVRVGKETAKVVEKIYPSLGTGLPRAAERRLLAAGGRRQGMVDITDATKRAIFSTLEDGRNDQLGAKEMARAIRERVPAGRYTQLAKIELADGTNAGQRYRSELIARAESKTAQNLASVEVYRDSPNVTRLEANDARIGDDHLDECIMRDGQIFTLDEAEDQDLNQPNCSLSWTPIVD